MWYALKIRSTTTSNRLMRFLELLVAGGTCKILEKRRDAWLVEVWVAGGCVEAFTREAMAQGYHLSP